MFVLHVDTFKARAMFVQSKKPFEKSYSNERGEVG